jgi:hypothetical protein
MRPCCSRPRTRPNASPGRHLPFVADSFHFGAATVAASKDKAEHAIGAQDALIATDRHVLEEARRITKKGGLVVAEIWARPIDHAQAPIRFSDTPVTKDSFDRVVQGDEPTSSARSPSA